MLNNSVSVCFFPVCFSEVKYVTVLTEQIGQLLVYMCRVDINSTNEATITTCEESLRDLFRLQGWQSGYCLGSKNLLQLTFRDTDRLLKRYAQVSPFCCPDNLA